jgi:hypothetical protein
MSEGEEWITAANAVALLGMDRYSGSRTICRRAHAGLIKARTERFIRDGQSADNVDVPAELWWQRARRRFTKLGDWRLRDMD